VAKVKKAARVTGERNIKGGKKVGARRAKAKTTSKSGEASRKPKVTRPAAKRAKGTKAKQKPGSRGKSKPVASGVKGKRTMKGTVRSTGKKGRPSVVRGRRVTSDAPVVKVAIRELDPLRKCGPNTTVQFLYRVDESVDGRSTAHLVFFDRHGWYCEHGRTCPAVGHAKKYNGQIARVS
jgi:hypothetical protein